MNQNLIFMQAALEEAHLAAKKDEVPVGAVIVKDQTIVARAHNQRITTNNPCGHAEVLALQKAAIKLNNWILNGCQMFVTLEPCAMCAGASVLARLDKIYFATHDPKSGVVSLGINILDNKSLNHQVKIEQGPLKNEASEIIKSFFRAKRNNKA